MTRWVYATHPKTGAQIGVRTTDYGTRKVGDSGQSYEDQGYVVDYVLNDATGERIDAPTWHASRKKKTNGDDHASGNGAAAGRSANGKGTTGTEPETEEAEAAGEPEP